MARVYKISAPPQGGGKSVLTQIGGTAPAKQQQPATDQWLDPVTGAAYSGKRQDPSHIPYPKGGEAWIDPKTGAGYSGPMVDPSHVMAEPRSGLPAYGTVSMSPEDAYRTGVITRKEYETAVKEGKSYHVTAEAIAHAEKTRFRMAPTPPVPLSELRKSGRVGEYMVEEVGRDGQVTRRTVYGRPPEPRTPDMLLKEMVKTPTIGAWEVKEGDRPFIRFGKTAGKAFEEAPFLIFTIPASAIYGTKSILTEPTEAFGKTYEFGGYLVSHPVETAGMVVGFLAAGKLGGKMFHSEIKPQSIKMEPIKIKTEPLRLPSARDTGLIDVTTTFKEGKMYSRGEMAGMTIKEGIAKPMLSSELTKFEMVTKPGKKPALMETDVTLKRVGKDKIDMIKESDMAGKVVTTFGKAEDIQFSAGEFLGMRDTGQLTLRGRKMPDIERMKVTGIEKRVGEFQAYDLSETVWKRTPPLERGSVVRATKLDTLSKAIGKGEVKEKIRFESFDVALKEKPKPPSPKQARFRVEPEIDAGLSKQILETDLVRKMEAAHRDALRLVAASDVPKVAPPLSLEKITPLSVPKPKAAIDQVRTGKLSAEAPKPDMAAPKGEAMAAGMYPPMYGHAESGWAEKAKPMEDFELEYVRYPSEKAEVRIDVRPAMKISERAMDREINRFVHGEKVRQKERTALKPMERLVPKEEILPALKEGQVLRDVQRMDAAQRQASRQADRLIMRQLFRAPTQPREPRPPRLPKFGLPRMAMPSIRLKAPKLEPGFHVFTREAGKEVKLSARPLSRGEALSLGAREVIRTPRGSFRLERAGRMVRPRADATWKGVRHMFRPPKGRSRLRGESFVEKAKFRIDQPGEVRGITMKGVEARRSKGMFKDFLYGPKRKRKR